MHCHTSYICLNFLRCALLNVSSNHVHQKMHSHIGYICLTFLHCVFSNVSLMHFYDRMQIYIGCICLIFLQYLFLNESSNHVFQDFVPSSFQERWKLLSLRSPGYWFFQVQTILNFWIQIKKRE